MSASMLGTSIADPVRDANCLAVHAVHLIH